MDAYGAPEKTTYFEGQTFDASGLVVTGTFSDESEEIVTASAEFTCTPSVLTTETSSVSVVATVSDVNSSAYAVSVTVNESPRVTIEPIENGTLTIMNGSDEVSSGDKVTPGTTLTIKVTPNSGYKFKNWQYNLGDSWITRYTNPQDYVMPSSDVAFRANFETIPQYTYEWNVNGSVVKSETLYKGEDVEFPEASAPVGSDKVFYGWVTESPVDANVAPSLVPTSSVTASANTTYYAVFATRTPGSATILTDEITRAVTGIKSGSGYGDWSGKTVTSDATYAGQSAGGNDAIQIRATSPSSIISTTSGGKVNKVTIEWNSNTANGRTLNVYGSNTAYSAAADLYNDTKQGTLLGTIVYGTSTELEISGDYAYVGLRSDNNALYLNSISITWQTGTPDTYSDFTTTVPTTETATIITINSACTDGEGMYYATYSNDKAFVVSDEIEVSEISIVDGKLYVEAYKTGDVVPANTGVMVAALAGGSYTVELSNEAGTSVLGSDNMLKASSVAMGGDNLFYRLTMHNYTDLGFYWGAADGAAFSIAANKAYLAVPKTAGARIAGFNLFENEGEATAIEGVKTISTDAPVFNLNGQRVNSNAKGLLIKNGKKFMNR